MATLPQRLPQRDLPATAGARGPSVRLAGASWGAVAEIGQQASDLGFVVAQKAAQLQQATDLLGAQTDLETEADDLLQRANEDPDYRTVAQRTTADFDDRVGARLSSLSGEVKLKAAAHAKALRSQLLGATRTRAIKLQTEDAKATALTRADRLTQRIAATTGPERDAALAELTALPDALAAGGAIGRDDAVTMRQGLLEKVLDTQVLADIDRDPVAAAEALGGQDPRTDDPRLLLPRGKGDQPALPADATAISGGVAQREPYVDPYAGMDPLKRESARQRAWGVAEARAKEAVAAGEKRAAALEKARTEQNDTTKGDLLSRVLAGEPTDEAIETAWHERRLNNATDYAALKSASRAVVEAGGVSDAGLRNRLETRIRLGEVTNPRDVVRLIGSGLNAEDGNKALALLEQVTNARKEGGPLSTPEATFWWTAVRRATDKQGPFEKIDPQNQTVQDLLTREWHDRIVVRRESPEAVGKSLIDRYGKLPALNADLESALPYRSPAAVLDAFTRGEISAGRKTDLLRALKRQADAAAEAALPAATAEPPTPSLLDRIFGGGDRR